MSDSSHIDYLTFLAAVSLLLSDFTGRLTILHYLFSCRSQNGRMLYGTAFVNHLSICMKDSRPCQTAIITLSIEHSHSSSVFSCCYIQSWQFVLIFPYWYHIIRNCLSWTFCVCMKDLRQARLLPHSICNILDSHVSVPVFM